MLMELKEHYKKLSNDKNCKEKYFGTKIEKNGLCSWTKIIYSIKFVSSYLTYLNRLCHFILTIGCM